MTKLINQRTGSLYTRATSIVIQNPLDGAPEIRFNEEDVVVETDGAQKATGFSGEFVHAEMTDPQESFVLINPLTGEAIDGTTTGSVTELQVLMTSFYYYLKEKQKVAELTAVIEDAAAKATYYPSRIENINTDIANAEAVKTSDPSRTDEMDAVIAQLELDRESAENQLAESTAAGSTAESDLAALLPTLENDFS